MANFRMFRFLRRRMTIAAPRMAVRTHIPWYWRALFWIVVISVSLAFALWIYDAGRKFAGFDRNEVHDELTELRSRASLLGQENARLKADQNAADSKLAIEQTTQKNLAAQVQGLEAENTRLKEDLELFEGMVSTDRREGAFAINGLKLQAEGGQLRFRMLITRGARTGSIMGNNQEPEFAGRLEFQIEPDPAVNGAAGAMIRLPAAEDPNADATRVKFRYFQRVEGAVTLPRGISPRQAVVRLLEGDRVRTSQVVTVTAANTKAIGGGSVTR